MNKKSVCLTAATIVARPDIAYDYLDDNRYFAWEIVRRRRDYVAVRATTQRLRSGGAPIDLIRSPAPGVCRGLRFRRGS